MPGCFGVLGLLLFDVGPAPLRLFLARSRMLRRSCLFFLRLRFMFRVLRGFCFLFLRFRFVFFVRGIANARECKGAK
jgi:hypothetical protein